MSLGGGRSMEAMRMRACGAWRLARAGSYDSPHRERSRPTEFVFRSTCSTFVLETTEHCPLTVTRSNVQTLSYTSHHDQIELDSPSSRSHILRRACPV